jgi:hypothetical protein
MKKLVKYLIATTVLSAGLIAATSRPAEAFTLTHSLYACRSDVPEGIIYTDKREDCRIATQPGYSPMEIIIETHSCQNPDKNVCIAELKQKVASNETVHRCETKDGTVMKVRRREAAICHSGFQTVTADQGTPTPTPVIKPAETVAVAPVADVDVQTPSYCYKKTGKKIVYYRDGKKLSKRPAVKTISKCAVTAAPVVAPAAVSPDVTMPAVCSKKYTNEVTGAVYVMQRVYTTKTQCAEKGWTYVGVPSGKSIICALADSDRFGVQLAIGQETMVCAQFGLLG